MSDPIKQILSNRQNSHGEFRMNSIVSQHIKAQMHCAKNWHNLAPYKKETLEMIAHKIGRLLEGDALFQDHWDDIVGYATLAAVRNREDNMNTGQSEFKLESKVNKT